MRVESVEPGFLLSYCVRDLQSICGDELRELLQTLDEPNLPAELLAENSDNREIPHEDILLFVPQIYCC